MSPEKILRTIGKVLHSSVQRDAIHVAIAPVTVVKRAVMPGERVGMTSNYQVPGNSRTVGIIDPFLRAPVNPGEQCWLFLFPGSVTDMRHEWKHPLFQEAKAETIHVSAHIEKSREWIRQHAEDLEITDKRLMADAETWLSSEEFTIQSGTEHWRDTFNPVEFWHHYEVVTGCTVPLEKKRGFYCCTC